MVNPNMANQVASSEPTVGIALTQFTPPNPLQMEKSMNLKYRLIYADTGIPCSDWSDDAEHFLRYLANRPDFVPKIIVMVEESNLVGVLNANGKWMLVPKEEAYKYNGNDDEGLAVFGLPPDATADDINKLLDPLVPYYDGGREFLIPKSEADDLERFDEFERAADAADAGDDIDDGSIEMSSVDFVKVLQARAAEKEA